MSKKFLVCFIFSVLIANSFCLDNTEKKLDNKVIDSQRTFVIAGANYHLNLNPHTAGYSNEAQILNGLYEGLFSYEPQTLEPIPALASEYKISRDKKRWTFTIRENAAFSDGSLITPQTIIDSWILLQETPDASYASLLDCIVGIKDYREGKLTKEEVGLKARENKLIVQLNTPAAHLPRLLCHHAFSAFLGTEGKYSGAYEVSEKNENYLFIKKNENYWDKDSVSINQIKILFSDDIKENSWLINTGKADWINGSVDVNALLNKNVVRVSAAFGTTYLFFTNRNAPWTNPELRNALLTAIPWDELRKGNLIPATTLVYPLSGYPPVEGLTYSCQEDAIEMLAEYRKKANLPETELLELSFGISNNNFMKEIANVLKNAWEPLGVKLNILTTPEDRYHSSIPYWNCDIFAYSWIGDFADPLAFLELFRKDSTLNQTKWENQKFEELLILANETTDYSERHKLLSKAEQLLLDDGVIIPICHSVSLHAINLNAIGGWFTNALDIHPFKYLYFKEYTPPSAPNIVKKQNSETLG